MTRRPSAAYQRSEALHAMSAYRRTVGNETALPLLRDLLAHADALVKRQAGQQAKKAEKALLKSG